MSDKNIIGVAGIALLGIGVYWFYKTKSEKSVVAKFAVGQDFCFRALPELPSKPVEITAVHWNNIYKQWEYSLYDIIDSMQYSDWYLEEQITEWFASPYNPPDQICDINY